MVEHSKVAMINSPWQRGNFYGRLVGSLPFNKLTLLNQRVKAYLINAYKSSLMNSHPLPVTVGQVELQICVVRESVDCFQCSIVCFFISESE